MRRFKILVLLMLLLVSSNGFAQEYRDIEWSGGVINHWFPSSSLLEETQSQVVEFFDAEGKPLERVTGIFVFDNRLYVYDSATGHAHLYSTDRQYLTQLTDPCHPINPMWRESDREDSFGSVISADPAGRVLLATGSGMHLIDGIQYALPGNFQYTRAAVLFDDTLVTLRLPYSIPGDESCRIETFSLLGGKASTPFNNIVIDEWDKGIVTDGKILVVYSQYPQVKIATKGGSVKTIVLDGMLAPGFITGKASGQRLPDGRWRHMPQIWNAQIYKNKLYLFLFSNYGHHFVCEYDLDGTMLRAWQVDRPRDNKSFINAMVLIFSHDTPQIYAFRQPYGEFPPPGDIVVYTPVPANENAEAVQ